MDIIIAIASGAASLFTACLAFDTEIMFFGVMWLIACFILGCISIAKFHEFSEDYGGSIVFVIAQIVIILLFVSAVFKVFNILEL